MLCDNCSSRVNPVVVFDVDGTLGDWHTHFIIDFLPKYLGLSDERWSRYNGHMELSDWLRLDKRTYQDAKLAFRAGGFKRWMPPFPGYDHLVDTAVDLELDIWIATTRPWMRLDNVDPDTRFWLHTHGINPVGIVYGEDKYERLLDGVDRSRIVMVLDDQIDQVLAAHRLGMDPILVQTKWNAANWPGRITTFDSMPLHAVAEELISRTEEWMEEAHA